MTIAAAIRTFLDDLFYSRLTLQLTQEMNILRDELYTVRNKHTEELEKQDSRAKEAELRLRTDYDYRLQDKDAVIAELRSEKSQMQAKMTEYELTLMPRSSKAGSDYVRTHVKPEKPNFGFDFSAPPPISRWQAMVDAHEADMATEAAAEADKAKETAEAITA